MTSDTTEHMSRARGWFDEIDLNDAESGARAIRNGAASRPRVWAQEAVTAGAVSDEAQYYSALREASILAAREAIAEHARGVDEHIKHAIRTCDHLDRVANEIDERLGEWTGLVDAEGDHSTKTLDFATSRQRVGDIVTDIRGTRSDLETAIERAMHNTAPNLTALAGPLLGARLIAAAGDLERLAKLPSGTVQVLGAEDALFAHLTDGAPPPKHGIIYTHEFVRGTAPGDRGSAARAVAGKLAIAARIDHYSGDLRPSLEAELRERIDRIRERTT